MPRIQSLRLKDVKPGDILIADHGFTCLPSFEECMVFDDPDINIKAWESSLYVKCSEGRHFLDGQLNDFDCLIGFKKKEQS